MHPLSWFAWVGTASLVTLLTRNPLYIVLLFVIFILVMDVERASRRASPDGSGYTGAPSDLGFPLSPLRFALFAVPAGALFNLLTSHVGETVFFRLPHAIPLIGGALTAEALLYGAISGLVLVTLFSAFAVLNLALPVRDLIAYLPRAFYPVAIVSAIAVTFVPHTLRQFRQVREAQAIRGYRMRGWRDWLPLFLPVLVGGLERALELAEAMTARGFGGGARTHLAPVARISLVAGLAGVLGAGVAQLTPGWASAAPVFLTAGALLMGAAIWHAGRGVQHTRYRRPAWHWVDTFVVLGCGIVVVPFLIWAGSRAYSPYPALAWPLFDLRLGGSLLGLMAPAFARRFSEQSDDHI